MKRTVLISFMALTLLALNTFARPLQMEIAHQPQDSPSPRVEHPATTAITAVDTTYLLGGPDRLDGSFETADGQPDWHGWTHEDVNANLENHWHVSTYMADQIAGKGPGNHAMYCGDETIPACAAPDTIGGYGNGWFEEIEWIQSVADPLQPVTVRLTGAMNYDSEGGYDYIYLIIHRGADAEILASWDGHGTTALDITTVLSPGDFTGPGGDQVRLVWRFRSDDSYSDGDCNSPSRGACQIDDLSVFLDGNMITFDDFEPGNPVNWNQADILGVGDFSNLRNDLGDRDPCPDRFNNSYMVNFIDDGVVVPGTGGTACIDYCYDPGGWVVNHNGGLMQGVQGDWHLDNRIVSPPMAWIPGKELAELAMDLYLDDGFTDGTPGIFLKVEVRSTTSTDPADLEFAPWTGPRWWFHGLPRFRRQKISIGGLLVTNPLWTQVSIRVFENNTTGLNGPNGTPAPYIDNVSVKVWDSGETPPVIQVSNDFLFLDTFPESKTLDPNDPGSHSCRLDVAENFYPPNNSGDYLVADVKPVRSGATVTTPPSLHWVMQCNPVFTPYRSEIPDGQGILRGMATGETVYYSGNLLENKWSFDLPDSGFFWPGDRLHYYITASDDLGGNVLTSVWPPDTTAVLDFSPDSSFPKEARTSALPTLTSPQTGQFDQPSLLLVEYSTKTYAQGAVSSALRELGFQQDVDFDHATVYERTLGKVASLDLLDRYETIVFDDDWGALSVSGQNNEAQLLLDWLATGNRKALFAGIDLSFNLKNHDLLARLGVLHESRDIVSELGSSWDFQISPVPGNGVLPDQITWQLDPGCKEVRWIDAISPNHGVKAASLEPSGSAPGYYSSLITVDDRILDNRTAFIPFDLSYVVGMTAGPGKSEASLTPQASYLNYILYWLGTVGVSGVEDLPGIGQVSVTAHPNPFNPSTTISFELPLAAEVSLDIYDLQGRLVRSLLDESPYVTGSHKQVWDGRDGKGRATSSGVYFYRFTTGDQKRVGKLTLLK